MTLRLTNPTFPASTLFLNVLLDDLFAIHLFIQYHLLFVHGAELPVSPSSKTFPYDFERRPVLRNLLG